MAVTLSAQWSTATSARLSSDLNEQSIQITKPFSFAIRKLRYDPCSSFQLRPTTQRSWLKSGGVKAQEAGAATDESAAPPSVPAPAPAAVAAPAQAVSKPVEKTEAAAAASPAKPPAAKPAAKKPAAKKLVPAMLEDVIPKLTENLNKEEGLVDLTLIFADNQLRGSFKKDNIPYAFWCFFPDGTLEGARGFSLATHGGAPSTVEPFIIDEKKITPEIIVFWVTKRLFAQKLLSLN